MSVRQLVDRIAELELIDDRILKKLRREIDDPEKNVKSKSILGFLVKKGHITKAQATKLLKETQKPADEIEVAPTPVNVHDTDALIGVTPEEIVEPEEELVEVSSLDEITPVEVEEVVPVEDVVAAVEPAPVEPTPAAAPVATPVATPALPAYMDPLADPIGGDPLAGGLDDMGSSEEKPARTLKGFSGKKDTSDQWSTRWLYIGFGLLGFLILMGGVLWLAVSRQNLEALQEEAKMSFSGGAYANTMSLDEKMLKLAPNHDNANQWRVRQVHCPLAQSFEGKNYSEFIKVAEELLPTVSEFSEFDTLRDDLGKLMLPAMGVAVTKASVQKTNLSDTSVEALQEELALAKRVEALCDNPAYITSSDRKLDTVAKQLEAVKDNVRRIEYSIKKESDYNAARASIVELTEAARTDDAFATFDALVRNYPNLGAREELRALLRDVSAKEIELVKPAGVQLEGQTEELDTLVESYVVIARREGNAVGGLNGEIVPVLNEGVLYGFDIGDGTVRWSRFLGFETQYQARWADDANRDSLIVSDQKNHSIMKLDASRGTLIWRTEIEEGFAEPTVTPEKIFVSTYSGKMIGLNTIDGNTFASVTLPQKLNVGCCATPRYPFIYQPGDYSNIYVLSTTDLSCMEVVYIGHSPSSIVVKPQEWSGYLLQPICQPDYTDLLVLRPAKEDGLPNGLGVKRTQTFLRITGGHIRSPLLRMGRRYLAYSDTGSMRLLDLNKAENPEQPISSVAQNTFEVRKGEKSYLQATGNRLWIANKGIERYRLSQLGEFKSEPIVNPGDSFLGPMTRVDDTIVHIRRRARSPMASVSAVDSQSMNPSWQSDLGASLAGKPVARNNRIEVVNAQGDTFSLDDSALKNGYIDRGVWAAKEEKTARLLRFENSVSLDDGSHVYLGPAGNRELVFVDPEGNSKIIKLRQGISQASCPILPFKNSLLIASKGGQVLLVDPRNGLMKSNFQPRVKANQETIWRTPATLGDLIVAGKADGNTYLLRSDGRDLERVGEIKLDGKLASGLVAIDQTVFGVVHDGESHQLVGLSTDGQLSQTGSKKLQGGVAAGPWAVGGLVLFQNDLGSIEAHTSDLSGEALWEIPVENDTLAANPIVRDGTALLAMRSGQMTVVNLQSGESMVSLETGQPISHAPLFVGDKIFVGGADGRLLMLSTSAFKENF